MGSKGMAKFEQRKGVLDETKVHETNHSLETAIKP
jgi:hypothetical protein